MKLYEKLNNELNLTLTSNKEVNWQYICSQVKLNDKFIVKFKKYILWGYIEKHINDIDNYNLWDVLISYQKLSEQFIENIIIN